MVGLGSIALSAFPIFATLLGIAFESELGDPDLMSWLPWALAFDTFPIITGIFGINAGRLILRSCEPVDSNQHLRQQLSRLRSNIISRH